ncbi:hypothetical protein [Ruegeria sp. R14_0]|uniref:hypothetical protein n=1 Tax=Ruegeria sp. R14_0 TaxID=2821100 RepID=UPI001ADA7115|nr:hypothetical protein [Ruegeria sp. R14_0]MBO9446516.1 hypothetical protein [Ruegeria sp. R14_0]
MTAAIIAFCCLAVVSFLSAMAVAHFLSRSGFTWIVFLAFAVSAISIAYLFPSSGDGPPDDADFLTVALAWSLVFPALSGSVLGGVIGAIKKMRRNR